MNKIKSTFLFLLVLLIFYAPVNADTYKDTKFKFQITSSDSWKTKAYFEGPDRMFDTMSPDENVLVQVRAIQLIEPLPIDIIRQIYERDYFKGASLYKEETQVLNGISGSSFYYHWKYNGHDIDVVAWIAVVPKMAFIISRIIPDQVLIVRAADANKVIQSFTSSLKGTPPSVKDKATPSKPLSKISLKPEKSRFEPDQDITVAYFGLPAKGQDWLALSDINHGPDEYFDMVMLEGKPKSGNHTFTGLPEGNYEVRVYTNWPDGGYAVAAKTGIKVDKAPPAPKPPVALVKTPKKPRSQVPVKPQPPKPVKSVQSVPIAKVVPIKTESKAVVAKSSGEPALKAEDAPKGLGVDVPSNESWAHADLGMQSLDEIKKKFNIPASPPFGDWRITERKNGGHVVTQYIDKKNKNFKIQKQIEFSKGKVDRIITGTADGKQIKVWFDSSTGKVTSVDSNLNEVSDGPRYTYNGDGTPKCVYWYKAKDDAEMKHGRWACSENGVLQYEHFYENNKETGTWKDFSNGKLVKIITYENGRKHGLQATYNNGKLVSWYTAKNGERVGDIKTP